MSIQDGNPVNAAYTNTKLASKEDDNTLEGKQALTHNNVESGADIADVQKTVNAHTTAIAALALNDAAFFAGAYPDDATFEAAQGAPPYVDKNGFYFNTTINRLRVHDGTVWRTNERALDNATGSDPLVTDDNNSGYEVLSLWLNTTSGALFRATDVTIGAAVWQEIAMDAALDAHIGNAPIHVDWSLPGAGTIDPTNYVDNDTAYTHPNHTGEVTSTGDGAQVLDPTAVSNKTLKAVPVGTEEVLINDAGTLKKTTAQAIADLGGGGDTSSIEIEYGEDLAAGDPVQIYDDAGTPKVQKATVTTETTAGTSTPSDATIWTSQTEAETNTWKDVAFGAGLFVAVSGSGTNRVMTSPDGVTWTSRIADTNFDNWAGVSFLNGQFVAVGNGGPVMTSPDGITWTNRTIPEANGWASPAFGNSTYVSVSSDGTNRVMISSDAITWTSQSASAANPWASVTFGAGLFVAVASSGTDRVMTSPDGITWTPRTVSTAAEWNDVEFGGGVFVAVAKDSASTLRSTDGITWTLETGAADKDWQDVIYGNGLFVAVGEQGVGNRVMTSPDGITWTSAASASDNNWTGVAYGNDSFVAVSDLGTDRVMLSAATIIPGSSVKVSDYIGIAETTALTGTTNTVTLVGGTSTAITGQTPGENRYLQDDGSSSSVLTSIQIGTFLDSGNMLVLKDSIGTSSGGGGGGSSVTNYQTKVVSSNVTTNGDIADITFNNLTIGNTYRVYGNMTFRGVGTSTGLKNIRFTIKNGGTDIGAAFVRAYQGTTTTIIVPNSFDITFVATDTTIVPDTSSISSMEILADNPASSDSRLTLEELPNHTEVTTWT